MSLKAFVGLGVVVFSAIAVVSGIRAFALQANTLAVARQEAVDEKYRADSISDAAAQTAKSAKLARQDADKERRLSDKLVREAVSLENELGRLEVAYAIASQEAPDTCATLIAQADSVLEQAGASILQWHAALASARVAYSGLSQAYDSVSAANESLQSAVQRLSAKTGALVNATHVSFFRRLLPQPHVGVTFGLSTDGRPAVVVGVGAGWRL